jgi:hypothetical protein
MALKPDDQYEYLKCTECGENKKVYRTSAPEPLWNHDEWIYEDAYLNDVQYLGLCFRCCSAAIRANWKKGLIDDREKREKPIPQWMREM